MLSYVITLLFVCFILYSPPKGIIVAAFIIQPLTYLGCGIGTISLYYVAAAMSVLFVVFGKMRNKIKTYPKLLAVSTTLMAVSYLITNAVCSHPKTVMILGNILTQFMFPVALWCVLDKKRLTTYAVRCIVVLSVLALVVMVPELVLRHNYFTDFIQNNFIISDFIIDAETVRFGLKRTNSIFSYFSTFGTFCCLSTFIIWIVIKNNLSNRKIYIWLMFLLPFAAFSTGSRAVFLAIFCIVIGLVTQRRIMQTRLFKLFFMVCILLLPLVYDYFSAVVDSIVNSDTTKTASGSSTELRLLQWDICLPYFLKSPVWGNGRLFIWEEVAPYNPMLLGAESIWFSLLVDYGIMGALTYILMILCCIFLFWKIEKRLIFMPLGYFFILFLSPDTGIQYNMLLTFAVLAVKLYQFNVNKKKYQLNVKSLSFSREPASH